ncbi:MAG: adenylate kinase [bacterium]
MRAIILLGAPGAGKGTLADGIKAASRFRHVSTGDMLRGALKQGTPVGREAEAFMKRGELVPDEIIFKLVELRIAADGGDEWFMFDGFPRTQAQAERLDVLLAVHGGKVNHVFLLDAQRSLLLSRLTGRCVCRGCGAVYHIVNIPPKRPGVCDICDGELYQRADDQEATIANRLDVYERQTAPLTAYYERQGVLTRVDAGRARQESVAEILAVATGRG